MLLPYFLVTVGEENKYSLGYILPTYDTYSYCAICFVYIVCNSCVLASVGYIVAFVYHDICIRTNFFHSLYTVAMLNIHSFNNELHNQELFA